MICLEALEKIDHTICLNYNNHTLAFNLDSYKDGPNGCSIDCKDFVEYTECYETVENELKEGEKNKKKLMLIGEVLVDVSKGNYTNLNDAIKEIREVLE